MDTITGHKTVCWDGTNETAIDDSIIVEEPLSIRIQGNPYAVIMRTPGEETVHAAGFCLAEGIVDTPDDIVSIGFCDDSGTNVVTVTLSESRKKHIEQHLDRREFISQTSCGLCGKEVVDDLIQKIRPIDNDIRLDTRKAMDCLRTLSGHQPLREVTRAAHAAALFNSDFELLASSEDVGRHNALDKTVGKVFLEKKLKQAALLILSSRISYELVQKAARARIPIIMAVSRPTSLAVSLAAELNMTLANLRRPSGLNIYCGSSRLVNR